MARGGFWIDGDPDRIKLEDDKRFCQTRYCYQIIWSWNKYCEYCQLHHHPETYAKRCLLCWRKTLYNYCDKHDKTCFC